MLISYRWITQLLGADPGVSLAADALTLGGLEVEHTSPVGAELSEVVAARVLSCRPHPSSKNPLSLVTLDRGGGAQIEVVCGAPNVPPPGGTVAFAPLGATVFLGGSRVTLHPKTISGFLSEGMLCAEDELGLGTEHGGIVILDEFGLSPGESLGKIPGFTDHIMTLNVTPNRGDALCHLGVARELAALLRLPFDPARSLGPPSASPRSPESELRVKIAAPDGCPRYAAVVLRNVRVAPSGIGSRVRLHRLGVRPINNVVDVTNLVMLERGQPLHAFDLSELRGGEITVRRALAGEVMKTLDGALRSLVETDLVISDAEGAVALAGCMGGERSGITDRTTEVVIECAAFEPAGVRRTSRRLGLRTESSQRFERGTDRGALRAALDRATSQMCEASGGLASEVVEVQGEGSLARRVPLRPARANALLGTEISRGEMLRSLRALGCEVSEDGDSLSVQVPTHRNDLVREVDLIEEVARVWGYEKLEGTLTSTQGARVGAARDWKLRRRLRTALTSLGLDEAIHYVFIAPRDVTSLGLPLEASLRLANPLSEERSVLRPSLLPRLCAALSRARRHGESRVRLFEVGSVFAHGAPRDLLPEEISRVGLLIAGPRDGWLCRTEDVDFYDMKGLVEGLCVHLTGDAPELHRELALPPWAHPRRGAWVRLRGAECGVLAELHPDVIEGLDLGRGATVCELDLGPLGEGARALRAKAPPRHPAVRRDVALALSVSVPAGAVAESLRASAGPLCESVRLFDRYTGEGVAAGEHSLAFEITWRAEDRSLQDVEVDALAGQCLRAARESYGAQQR